MSFQSRKHDLTRRGPSKAVIASNDARAGIWRICTDHMFKLIDHLRAGASVVKNVTPQPARANVAS